MTRSTHTRAGILPLLLLIAAGSLAGCGDSPPETNRNTGATNAAPTTKPAEPAPTSSPRPVLATSQTEWPGVEARLRNVGGKGGLLFVEVELVNTGSAPVAIEHYSAASATMTDDASKQLYEPFAQPGHPPSATVDLTQTLAPGELTTVNASFPLPSRAALVTLVFPKIGRFDAIPLEPKTGPPADKKADDTKAGKGEKKADKKG